MSLTIVMAIVSMIWVFVYRKHKILLASQPQFLYLIGIGSIMQTSAIFPVSFDESTGWNETQLNRACMASPWLLALGYIIVYSSLFTKLWRVNKVLQFTRRKIKIRHVAWPMALLVLAALIILCLWTIIDPLRHSREEINDITGESIARCEGDYTFAFVGPLVVIMLIPTVLTGIMAYRTKDVDDSYTESWWIFVMIVVQVEVTLVSVPLIILLNNESTDGSHLGFIFILSAFPMTTLALIFFPKMVAHRNAVRGVDACSHIKRGERGKGRISGLDDPQATPVASKRNDTLSVVQIGSGPPVTSGLPSNEKDPLTTISSNSSACPVIDKEPRDDERTRDKTLVSTTPCTDDDDAGQTEETGDKTVSKMGNSIQD